MPGRLLLEYGVFQVPLINTNRDYDLNSFELIKDCYEVTKILIIFQDKLPLETVQDLLRVAGIEKRQFTFFQDPSDGLNFSHITLLKGKKSTFLLLK